MIIIIYPALTRVPVKHENWTRNYEQSLRWKFLIFPARLNLLESLALRYYRVGISWVNNYEKITFVWSNCHIHRRSFPRTRSSGMRRRMTEKFRQIVRNVARPKINFRREYDSHRRWFTSRCALFARRRIRFVQKERRECTCSAKLTVSRSWPCRGWLKNKTSLSCERDAYASVPSHDQMNYIKEEYTIAQSECAGAPLWGRHFLLLLHSAANDHRALRLL